MFNFLEFGLFLFGTLLSLVIFLLLPIAYFEGKTKSKYLKEEYDLDYAWYQAIFLPESIYTRADVTLKNVNAEKE